MTTELQTVSESHVGDALPASAIRAQVNLIQEVMKTVMVKDEHYGVIPGCVKPSLLKPGAEKLCLTFRLDPEYDTTERFVGEHLFIKSKCTLFHITSGRRMGSGEGSCSTKESKYAYRQGKRVCPQCGKEAIIKGKEQYGGGWLCWKKKEGCGAQWPAGAEEIEGQSTERVPNEDLADQYNTILKMANKRSLVAAVLNVTAASDIFTQDIEDMPEFEVKKHKSTEPRQEDGVVAHPQVGDVVLPQQVNDAPASNPQDYISKLKLSESVREASQVLNDVLSDESLSDEDRKALQVLGKQRIADLSPKKRGQGALA